jgi:hypothetical protein
VSLAVTVASLVQAGFGREVVVGYHLEYSELANNAFCFLCLLVPVDIRGNTTRTVSISKIGMTEVGYI